MPYWNSQIVSVFGERAFEIPTSRTGDVVLSGNAVSYSYGGRQTLSAFNDRVSKHVAPTYNDIETNPVYSGYQLYNGNIGDASESEPDPFIYLHGEVGTGNKMWTGLYEFPEYSAWLNNQQTMIRYAPWNWAGIDCIGLVLHILRYAERPSQYGQDQDLVGSGDVDLAGILLYDVCVSANCSTKQSIHTSHALGNVNVVRFFDTSNTDFLYYWVDTGKLIHKGDFVRYGNTHISIVYSERWGKSEHNGDYDIIHALGYNTSDLNNDQTPPYEFSRRVVLSPNIMSVPQPFPNPTGFGRIKLW